MSELNDIIMKQVEGVEKVSSYCKERIWIVELDQSVDLHLAEIEIKGCGLKVIADNTKTNLVVAIKLNEND